MNPELAVPELECGWNGVRSGDRKPYRTGPRCFLVWPREGRPWLARTNVLRRRLQRLLGTRTTTDDKPSRMLNLRGRPPSTGSRDHAGIAVCVVDLARQHLDQGIDRRSGAAVHPT